MRSKTELMRMIQKYDFALYDLMLYLDTHPRCKEAMALFDKYRMQRSTAVKEYVERFGPIKALQSSTEDKWNWGAGPYPWEKEAN